MERRGFCRRLGLRVADVPLLRLYNSTARFCELPEVMALVLALHALDYSTKKIAFATRTSERTVRATNTGHDRLRAKSNDGPNSDSHT